MEQDKYLQDRVEPEINWYDKKSKFNKILFMTLQIIEITSAAIIPFLAGYNESIPHGSIIVGILGIVIALCAGLSSLYKFQENWLLYRTTCESLRHEKYLFLTKSKPYENEDSFNQFVINVENLISKENTQWAHRAKGKSHGENLQEKV